MAESRKTSIRILTLFVQIMFSFGLQCLDQTGAPVDWYILYKLPSIASNSNPTIKNGTAFYYMDEHNPSWVFSPHGMLDKNQAVYHTLQQIYTSRSGSIAYMMYNDDPPLTQGYLTHGHTKGAVAFNKTSGFWLITSLPNFPYPKINGYHYPGSGSVYGQTFLCISMNYDLLDVLGSIFLFTYPTVYDHELPTAYLKDNPNMASIVTGRQRHQTTLPWSQETLLVSKNRINFRSFEKAANFHLDLYDGWLSTSLNSELLVETWQNGDIHLNMGSNCTIPHKVYNIKQITFKDTHAIAFPNSKDHSKWVVTRTDGNWVCIGDINRQTTQFKRGGGQVCFQNSSVWKAFSNLVTEIENCHSAGRSAIEPF